MPVLEINNRETKILDLPSPKGTKVTVYKELTFGEAMGIMNKTDDIERGAAAILAMIKSWNLTNKDSKKLPINKKTLDSLPARSANILANEAQGVLASKPDKKK